MLALTTLLSTIVNSLFLVLFGRESAGNLFECEMKIFFPLSGRSEWIGTRHLVDQILLTFYIGFIEVKWERGILSPNLDPIIKAF